jgi:hypothetical protein
MAPLQNDWLDLEMCKRPILLNNPSPVHNRASSTASHKITPASPLPILSPDSARLHIFQIRCLIFTLQKVW